jgi:hypothetical protein
MTVRVGNTATSSGDDIGAGQRDTGDVPLDRLTTARTAVRAVAVIATLRYCFGATRPDLDRLDPALPDNWLFVTNRGERLTTRRSAWA